MNWVQLNYHPPKQQKKKKMHMWNWLVKSVYKHWNVTAAEEEIKNRDSNGNSRTVTGSRVSKNNSSNKEGRNKTDHSKVVVVSKINRADREISSGHNSKDRRNNNGLNNRSHSKNHSSRTGRHLILKNSRQKLTVN